MARVESADSFLSRQDQGRVAYDTLDSPRVIPCRPSKIARRDDRSRVLASNQLTLSKRLNEAEREC